MSKRKKPPNHLIDQFIENWFISDGEIRDIAYEKSFLEEQLHQFFDGKYEVIWNDFTIRIYHHQRKTREAFRRGIIVNPRTLKSEYEDDRRYWRDHANPVLVQNGIYYIVCIGRRDWTGAAKLETLSLVGATKAKYHLDKAYDEIDHMIDIGAKVKGNTQAKLIYKEIKEIQRISYEMDLEELEEEEYLDE